MSTGIKNGKLHTNNIKGLKMAIIVISVFIMPGFSQTPIPSNKTWVIVLDAGHGGKDPGALGAVSREKSINLAIALKTGEYLEQNVSNVKVLYTRKSDVFVEVKERAEFANRNKADLFISIHANWAGSKTVKGAETYVMGVAKDKENLEVAMKENEVILLEEDYSTKYEGFDPKSPESYIMFTLMQNIFIEQSTGLASNIQDQFKSRVGRIDRGVRQAGFWVLFMTTMPSVLIETGYITNPEEEKFLISKEGQEYIASAIYRACRDYIREADKKNSILAAGSDSSVPDDVSPSDNAAGIETGIIPVFMVQIMTSSSRKDINPDNFRGLKDVTEYKVEGSYKYATGNFKEYSEALDYRKKIRDKFPDAFVIAAQDNKILPLHEALDIVKQK